MVPFVFSLSPQVQESFELNHETLYTAVKMTDLYLSKKQVRLLKVFASLLCVTRTVLVNFKAFITLRIRIVLDAS